MSTQVKALHPRPGAKRAFKPPRVWKEPRVQELVEKSRVRTRVFIYVALVMALAALAALIAGIIGAYLFDQMIPGLAGLLDFVNSGRWIEPYPF